MLRRALLAVLLFPTLAFAWGGEGHQIVALIADTRLTPATKAACHDLLGADADIYDGEVANWADRIRRENPESGGYHFVDIPVAARSYVAARDGNDGKNVIDGINKYAAILGDKSASKQDREQALRWVIHLVGDLHQPLHCADREDRGGNQVAVILPGVEKPTNLHSAWDTGMLRTYLASASVTDYANAITAKITDKVAKGWAAGDVISWANETHMVAVKQVYADVPEKPTTPLRFTPKYIAGKRKVIDEQLARGGVRLATILNRVLDGTAKPPTATPAPATQPAAR